MNCTFIIKICSILIVVAVICLFLKRQLGEYSLILSIFAGTLTAVIVLVSSAQLIREAKQIYESLSLNNYHFAEILKILGLGTLVQFISDTLKDAGELALSFVVELAGKVSILYIAFPIIAEFVALVIKLLK